VAIICIFLKKQSSGKVVQILGGINNILNVDGNRILSNNNFSGMIPPGLLKKANLTFQ
jgi:hypothetical protein